MRRKALHAVMALGISLLTVGLGVVPAQAAAAGPAGIGQFSVHTDINSAADIVAGPDGALWFTNTGTSSIGRITTAGVISNYSVASIGRPSGIAVGSDGALWFTDNYSIGRITTDGAITDYVDKTLSSPAAIVAGPDGALWFTNSGGAPSIGRISTSGVITAYTGAGLTAPNGITVGPDNALWFTNTATSSVGRVTTAGAVKMFNSPLMNQPYAITAGSDGALWFLNAGNNSIDRISTAGVVTQHTDPGINVGAGDLRIINGPGGALWFTNVNGTMGRMTTAGVVTTFPGVTGGALATGSDGALWFAVRYPSVSLGRMTTTGTVTHFNGMNQPEGIAQGSDGAMWFINSGNSGPRSIGRIAADGSVTDFTDPKIVNPWAITAGPDGALWFTDYNVVGRITTAGVVTTFTGAGVFPTSITTGPDGALWFTNNQTAAPIGRMTTTGTFSFYTSPTISNPTSITAGADNALWFTNAGNSSIGRITTSGTVTNYPATGISSLTAITSGSDGALWFTGASAIGRITTAGVVTKFTATGIAAGGGITSGSDGALWFTNAAYNAIGRVTTAGVLTSYVYPDYVLQAGFIAPGSDGALWFTNPGNQAIGRITTGSPTLQGGYTSLTPSRILDTRISLGAVGPVAPGGTVTLPVLGKGGVPASGVGAVVLNVTVTQPTAGGYLTVWPHNSARPQASNLDFDSGQSVPNLVVAQVDTSGKVDFYNGSGGTVQIIGDVSGYFSSGAPGPGGLQALNPARILDTRIALGSSGPVAAGGTVSLPVLNKGGLLPTGVSAVVLNVTVTQPKSGGYLTVWPNGSPRPTTSNLDFSAGQSVPNLVVARVGTDGKVNFFNGSSGTVQVLADVAGYFVSGGPAPGGLAPLTPARILDTRIGLGGYGPVPAGGYVQLVIPGRGGVPQWAVGAVVLNITVTQPTAGGYLTVWPNGATLPKASNLDFSPGQSVPNLVITKVGSQGIVNIYNGSAGSVQILADVSGYFTAN